MGRDEYFRRFVPEQVTEKSVAFDNEILRVTVGSQLYGTNLDNGDNDEMGIYIEPIEYVVGFKEMQHFTWRSKPEGVKSEPGDTDLNMYSLRKFMSLAMQGNPSILLMLFAPSPMVLYSTNHGEALRSARELIISKRAYPRFRGYMQSQRQRLEGIRTGHMPKRTDLVDAYGYDTKYAMHVVRLGLQGIELMDTGALSLPCKGADWLKGLRQGSFTFDEMLRVIMDVEAALEDAFDRSTLREEPDVEALEQLMVHWHQGWWNNKEK
jgi:predicted nucleotidyltransferase